MQVSNLYIQYVCVYIKVIVLMCISFVHRYFTTVIQQTLPVLRDIVDSASGESTKSRQICYQSIQESVQVSLSLFPVFIQQSGRCLLINY